MKDSCLAVELDRGVSLLRELSAGLCSKELPSVGSIELFARA